MAAREDITRRVTAPTMRVIPGNPLFSRAVEALGLDPEVARDVLSDVLLSRGVQTTAVTPEELRDALPELEGRLRLYIRDTTTDAIVARVRGLTVD
jgi:hypothetical protein